KDGYKKEFSAALTATSALQGPIIPPSIPFVIFASLTNVSVGGLFIAGAIPGVMLGLVQIVIIFIMAKSKKVSMPRNYEKVTMKRALKDTLAAGYALLLPVIILGGMLSGFFTATEAAAVAAAYSLIIAGVVYKGLNFKNLSQALVNTAKTTGSIYLIIAFTGIISWILSIERVPDMINNLFLFEPIFAPIFVGLGVDPIHFGVIMVVNVMLGMITPPYGMALYLSSAISGSKLTDIVKASLPFLFGCLLVLLLITIFPQISLFLPNLFDTM